MIGFDTYPVEVRCSIAQIDNVYWMQRELVSLTARQADVPVDRGRPDGALPRERGSDARGRPRRDVARDRRRRARNRLLPRLVGRGHPQRGAPDEPRDPRARAGAPLPGREGELVDREPRPHRRAALQRRDVRHRGQHLDLADEHVVLVPGLGGRTLRVFRDGRTSRRSATSSPTSSRASASRSTSSRPPAGRSARALPCVR